MRWRSGVSGVDSILSSDFMVLKVNKCLKAKKNMFYFPLICLA